MLFELAAVLFFVALNGFFVAAEFAIVKVRRSQLELKVAKGEFFAVQAMGVVAKLDAYLSACQLGITLSSLALGWLGEPVVGELVETALGWTGLALSAGVLTWVSFAISFAIITFLHIVLGELVPKAIAIRKSEKTSYAIAIPLKVFYFTFYPFIALMNGIALAILRLIGISNASEEDTHTADELQILAQKSQEQGELDNDKYALVYNALEFDKIRAGSLMTARVDVYAIDLEWSPDKIWESLLESPYSRVVCYRNSWDQVLGFVHLKDFLKTAKLGHDLDLQNHIYPALFISEDRQLDDLLEDFKRRRMHLSVVVDEYGNSIGIVTLEDVLEILVGDIQDEDDEEVVHSEIIECEPGVWKVDPRVSIRDANRAWEAHFDEEEHHTLSGLLLQSFGIIPTVGEVIVLDNLEFKVTRMDGNRIAEVIVRPITP